MELGVFLLENTGHSCSGTVSLRALAQVFPVHQEAQRVRTLRDTQVGYKGPK